MAKAPLPQRAGLHPGLLYALLGLASLVLAGTTFLVVASPADLIRDRLIAQVQARTGRDLAVKGGASLTLFPAPGVVMRNVELSAPSGMLASPTLRAESVTARLDWGLLLERRIAVRALSLTRAVLDLAVDAQGRRSWDFARTDAQVPAVRVAQLAPRFGHGQGLPPDLYEALERVGQGGRLVKRDDPAVNALQEVRVTDGAVRYRDARNGSTYEVGGIDLRVGRSAPDTAQISGRWMLAGEQVAVEGEAQIGQAPAKLALRVSARLFEAGWDGGAAWTPDSTDVDGRVTIKAASTAALARWAGRAGLGSGFDGPLAVDGRLRVSGTAVNLSAARLTLGDATATGSIGFEPGRERPSIRADLKLSELKLDRYLPNDSGAAAEPLPESDDVPHHGKSTGSVGDLLQRTEDEGLPSAAQGKAKVRGSTRKRDAWSTESIETGFLTGVDLAGKLEIDDLSWRRIRMGPTRASIGLHGGTLTAEVEGAEFYGGRGKAVLSMHREGAGAFLGLTASVEDVGALPLMRDAAGFDWVEGRGRLKLAVTTTGASERELVEHLTGRADFEVKDGAVVGWSLAHTLRKLRQWQLTALERDAEAKTPFQELAGSFAIAAGVATNQDLKMSGPAAELTGAGSIILPQQLVDYTVRPKLTVTAAGERNAGEAPLSVEIPVRIQGRWSKPKLAADLQGALGDPRTAETVKHLGRQLRSGNVDEAVKGLFGGGAEGEEKAAKAKEMLKRFLRQ